MVQKDRNDLQTIVAAVYGAALVPERWPDVIDRILRATGAVACHFGRVDQEGPPILPEHADRDHVGALAAILDRYGRNHPWNPATIRLGVQPGDVVPRAIYEDDQTFYNSEFYNDYLKPWGLKDSVRLFIDRSVVDSRPQYFLISVAFPEHLSSYGRKPQRLLHQLYPHFRQAAEISLACRGHSGRERAALAALDESAAGVVILDAKGTAQVINVAAAETVAADDGLTLIHGRLQAPDARVNARLQTMLGEALVALTREVPPSGGAMRIPRPSGLPGYQVRVAPIFPGESGGGPGHGALVVITDPGAKALVPEEALRALYGLTAAEAKIALALSDGQAPQEIAAQRGLSLLTVRTHIGRLHDKLEVRHQGQLIRRILQVANLRHHPEVQGER